MTYNAKLQCGVERFEAFGGGSLRAGKDITRYVSIEYRV